MKSPSFLFDSYDKNKSNSSDLFQKSNFDFSEIDLRALDVLKKEVANIGAKLVFLLPPKHSDVMTKQSAFEEILKGLEIEVLDYVSLIDESLENKYFFDPYHLNREGLDILSKKISDYFK